MGVCSCPRQGPEHKIDEFWDKLEIVKYDHKDFEILYRSHKNKLISKENWDNYYFPKVKNNQYLKESSEFWNRVFEKYSKENHFKYLMFTLLLLCGKSQGHQVSFKKLIFHTNLNNLENNEASKDEIKTIKKKDLYEIIKVYINIVSYDSVVDLYALIEPDDTSIIEELKAKFCEDNQKILLGRIFHSTPEVIDVDEFFTKNPYILPNKSIREELHKIYIQKHESKMR